MNGLLTLLGIESWKPVVSALVLPPVPFFLLLLIGARLILPRRGLGWFVILLSLAGLWLSACAGSAQVLTQLALKPPSAYSTDAIAELKAAVKAKQPVAIVVLGGGAEPLAPEYGISNLAPWSLERLRYGLWLSRETGAPVAFSGGVGWDQSSDAKPEAEIASRIAAKEFGQPLKWLEDRSRDTRESAGHTLQLLKRDGITRVVLVTHGWHMPRAQKVFEQAAAGSIRIEPAPMGLAQRTMRPVLEWIPTPTGYQKVTQVLRELLALLVRA
ncbi:YdcF family protein [Piscinibacter sp. HJYY11]|uniref:YdcF family protein n=1 Tax=Piscinibacter sp. HJYY11 TaxID=2801333 RepID=UPI00191E4183|nr:YdcF family protein [Piscinibacter sp. HJYY11]MBL0730504.1 YdcF family protein [Piscinibacter sp. HJYY11]